MFSNACITPLIESKEKPAVTLESAFFRYKFAKSQMTFGMIFSYAFQGQNHYFTASRGGGGVQKEF
jgi:hypothetical protein